MSAEVVGAATARLSRRGWRLFLLSECGIVGVQRADELYLGASGLFRCCQGPLRHLDLLGSTSEGLRTVVPGLCGG